MVREYLEASGVDLSKFEHYHTVKEVVRRRLNRTFGGEITTPVPRTNKEIQQTLQAKIESGEYCLGEAVVPRQYKKLVIDFNGTLVEEEFTVSGRKIPLLEIRKRLLWKHEKEGLIRKHSDEHYNNMTDEEVRKQLTQLEEVCKNTGNCKIA